MCSPTNITEIITSLLEKQFQPTLLEVVDDSHHHAGHSGARPEGETHFTVTIISSHFQGLSRIQRHQAIYRALESLMNSPIHALAIKAYAPEEKGL